MIDLRVTLVQMEIAWEDPEANRQRLSEQLMLLTGTTDIIILPEMFTTGFTLNAEPLAEVMSGPTVVWIQQLAKEVGAVICGSIVVRDQSFLFNRFIWAAPSGELLHYDKRHLFRFAGEDSIYTQGIEKSVISFKGWKIRPFICYDLRFPTWSANVNKAYDLGIYVANWPEPRSAHWKALLIARAIENQTYIAGVNRIGRDDNNLSYRGNSMLVDPQGRIMMDCGSEKNCVTIKIPRSELEEYRKRFPAWMDLS